MYKIIGADQKQYGPISADQIRQWISEGRVNSQTMVCAEGSNDWKPLAEFPEFGFMAATPVVRPPASAAPMTREEIIARNYSLDLGSCFSRGWSLYKENFGTMFVTVLLFFIITIVASGLVQLIFALVGFNHLPFATQQYLAPIHLLFVMLVLGPAIGGQFHVFISLLRGQPTTAGEIFIGFKSFQDLFLGSLVPRLVGFVCMFPFTYVINVKIGPLIDRLQQDPHSISSPDFFPQMISASTSSFPIFFICLIPATYFAVNWQFTTLLIIDKKMGFWTALRTSWKMVHKHWFHLLGLTILIGLVNIPGFCLCVIGILFTMPLGVAALCYAYEDIFGRQNP